MIPKQLAHIWIGPLEMPAQWMETWHTINSDWTYQIYDNDYLNRHDFELQPLINEYMKRGEYSGVADLMRYEILFRHGGFIAPADSVCYRNVSELFTKRQAYTVYENEFLRGKLVAPVLACEPQNKFVGQLITHLRTLSPERLLEPWKSTGNLMVAKMIHHLKPDIKIFPSFYFNPTHYEGYSYIGDGPVYANQMFGSTTGAYSKRKGFFYKRRKKKMRKYRQSRLKAAYEVVTPLKLTSL